jgi:cardiolipin synthase
VRGVDDGLQALVTRSTAQKGSTDAEQLFYTAIVWARERIWLTTAYFAPRRAFVDALCDAVRRGVDVPVLTNGPHRQAGRPPGRAALL